METVKILLCILGLMIPAAILGLIYYYLKRKNDQKNYFSTSSLNLHEILAQNRKLSSEVKTEAYFIPLHWMKVISRPKSGSTEINDNHIMIDGKNPISLFSNGRFNSSIIGNSFSKQFKQTIVLSFKSVSSESLGQASYIKNCRGIVLMRTKESDDFYQFGSGGVSATVSAVDVSEDSIKLIIESYASVPFFTYKGLVPAAEVAQLS